MKELRKIFLKGLFFIFVSLIAMGTEACRAIYDCPEIMEIFKTKGFIICLASSSVSFFYFIKYIKKERELDRNSSR